MPSFSARSMTRLPLSRLSLRSLSLPSLSRPVSQGAPNDISLAPPDRRGRRPDGPPLADRPGGRRAMRQHGRRLRGLEAGLRRGGAGQARRRGRPPGPHGHPVRHRHHQRRPGPAELPPDPRPVPGQARRQRDRGARAPAQADPCGALRADRGQVRRAPGPAPRDLGHGDGVRHAARQPAHALGGRDARLRLPALRVLHRPALCRPRAHRPRHPLARRARLHARRDRPDPVHAQEHPQLRHRRQPRQHRRGADLDRELPQGPRLARRRGYQPGEPNFAAIQAWNAATVYQRALALLGQQIDGGGSSSARR
jgi:hypothetical protein